MGEKREGLNSYVLSFHNTAYQSKKGVVLIPNFRLVKMFESKGHHSRSVQVGGCRIVFPFLGFLIPILCGSV